MENKNKRILGLDLGTTSIGWADVIEGISPEESSINKIGVRVNPLTTDELLDFEKGKPISINADRTLKRGMRRNLDRYQLRRKNLLDVLKKSGLMTEKTKLSEDGKNTTFETWRLRAKSATEKIEKSELCRVLLAINKKRGYKSSRKAQSSEEGFIIDGMSIAKQLYESGITPGQYVFSTLKKGKRYIPDFYRSDLQSEFNKVWEFQKQFHPQILTEEFYENLKGKGQRATSAAFWTLHGFNIAEVKELEPSLKDEITIKLSSKDQKKLQTYCWRQKAISEKLEKEEMAYVLTDINTNLNSSSGYLGAISDRSKELYFNKMTVGQFLYRQLKNNPHAKLKNQVFYRQDYLDEFETIWTEQSKHYNELTEDLKINIRDIVIFYQRKLKSQKNLINFCEFENKYIETIIDNKKTKINIGAKVVPKSSPLFQEFKIWQILSYIRIRSTDTKEKNSLNETLALSDDLKRLLFDELNVKGNLKSSQVLKLFGYKSQAWEMNYDVIEGNRTNASLNEAYLKILDMEGYDVKELLSLKSNKDELKLSDLNVPSSEIKNMIKSIFESLKINTDILEFNAELDGTSFENQASYRLWHLLYSYEGDDSTSGNDKLYELLSSKFGFKKEHAQILANVSLSADYGSLSTKAIRKIFPYIKEHEYSEACSQAGYRHSKGSLTSEELENRPLKDKLELLKKNSLRNPVVEKILNQMVNVVNTLIDQNSEKDNMGIVVKPFKYDEIRIELGRDLKQNAKERAEATATINSAKTQNEKIIKILQKEFGILNPSKNDIVRYKLYEELKSNGYKDLYSDTYISRDVLFGKTIDVDHIIPQSRLFDDSFSNKTVVFKKDNLKKGNKTAIEYVESEHGDIGVKRFFENIEQLYLQNQKNAMDGISKAKFKKLQKRSSEINDGFIERDIRNTQYIAKKAKNILMEITRSVVSTGGRITDRLREDWGLINIMQEINFEKYKKLGLTEIIERKDGSKKERITDWSKRNDHRHHAMDALTVAFTKPSYIQYLNHLNARYDIKSTDHKVIKSIEEKETITIKDDQGNNRRVFIQPIANFRTIARHHLDKVLVSFKTKNKVVTKNKNIIKTKNGKKTAIELTPRGQLHKETIYGKYKYPQLIEEKIGVKFNEDTIKTVTNPQYREALLNRLIEFNGDPKIAFTGKNSINKNPIYLNSDKTLVIPEKVKLAYWVEDFSIRKEITPEIFKDEKTIEKIIDKRVREIIIKRLRDNGNDAKKAFSDLERNPIWLNETKGLSIKRVRISGVKNAEALQHKRNHHGETILDSNGHEIPADFVSTGNNHHVAIYKDKENQLHEKAVSFYEAVARVNQALPIIDKTLNRDLGWEFLFTMKQNEMFVFPNETNNFDPKNINLMDHKNVELISPNLFRVQKIATKNYYFRHHLETNVDDKPELKNIAYKNLQSLGYLEKIVKVRINHIGQIIQVGE